MKGKFNTIFKNSCKKNVKNKSLVTKCISFSDNKDYEL
jgi:hypothetical protein